MRQSYIHSGPLYFIHLCLLLLLHTSDRDLISLQWKKKSMAAEQKQGKDAPRDASHQYYLFIYWSWANPILTSNTACKNAVSNRPVPFFKGIMIHRCVKSKCIYKSCLGLKYIHREIDSFKYWSAKITMNMEWMMEKLRERERKSKVQSSGTAQSISTEWSF